MTWDFFRHARVACVVASLLALAAVATPTATAADQACDGEDTPVALDSTPSELDRARASLVCLIGQERRSRGLRTYVERSTLRRSALDHSRDMVRRHYFEHDSPGGSDMTDRIRRAGYLRKARRWSLGEALAWGDGVESEPQEIVAQLLDSPEHRALLLDPDFRDWGIGVAAGVPEPNEDSSDHGVTVTIDFGRVSRRH